jgi:DNA-binding XRE family transcriptional regulator
VPCCALGDASACGTPCPRIRQVALRGRAADLEWSVNVEAIEHARILHGWTRRDLARQAHIDEGTLSDLMAGRRRPTFGTLRLIGRRWDSVWTL